MEDILLSALQTAVEKLYPEAAPVSELPKVTLSPPTDPRFGDLSTNLALVLAARLKTHPRALAQSIVEQLDLAENLVDKVEVAGPGFINFYLHPGWWYQILRQILTLRERFACPDLGRGRKVQVEFVSANPTGPLHIGHGRGAAFGDALANILAKVGYQVVREYYINDAGRQMELLGRSVYARLRELSQLEAEFPEDGYRGEYIRQLAEELPAAEKERVLGMPEAEAVKFCAEYACREILASIRQDLEHFRVHFDHWVSEKGLYAAGLVDAALSELKEKGFLVEREGAWWLTSSQFGDEKDRVVIRSTGEPTYLASDIAYHREKYRQGYHLLINIWGADHHGYIDRLRASIAALGNDTSRLHILLVQLVSLLREGQPVAMSTREGQFTTLAEVVAEVGVDAARFFFLMRRHDSHLEFDLELAKKESSENPVYYVQYAHARIQSIFRQAESQGIAKPDPALVDLTRLAEEEEIMLLRKLAEYPGLIRACAQTFEPHRLTFYLQEVAGRFHKYYQRHRVISEDEELTAARLLFVEAIQIVLRDALGLLGVEAPERM